MNTYLRVGRYFGHPQLWKVRLSESFPQYLLKENYLEDLTLGGGGGRCDVKNNLPTRYLGRSKENWEYMVGTYYSVRY